MKWSSKNLSIQSMLGDLCDKKILQRAKIAIEFFNVFGHWYCSCFGQHTYFKMRQYGPPIYCGPRICVPEVPSGRMTLRGFRFTDRATPVVLCLVTFPLTSVPVCATIIRISPTSGTSTGDSRWMGRVRLLRAGLVTPLSGGPGIVPAGSTTGARGAPLKRDPKAKVTPSHFIA